MHIWETLFGKKKKMAEASAPQEQLKTEIAKEAYLTETVIFGMHPYRRAGEDSSVYFVDEGRGIRKLLIDSVGRIQDFPGMIREDFWVREVAPRYLRPQVCFRSSFEKRKCGWIFLWQLQPDGWYWADEDGFGAEKDLEVILYTYVDPEGCFTGPFRLYKLGNTGYAMDRFLAHHDRSVEQFLTSLQGEGACRSYAYDLFPQLLGAEVNHISDRFYQIRDREEAVAYWKDPVLSRDLRVLAKALLDCAKPLQNMLGRGGRVKGCMTLFYLISEEPVFMQVLEKFYGGAMDEYTVKRLNGGL